MPFPTEQQTCKMQSEGVPILPGASHSPNDYT